MNSRFFGIKRRIRKAWWRLLVAGPKKVVFSFIPAIILILIIQISAILFSNQVMPSLRSIQFSTIAENLVDGYDKYFIYDPDLFWRLKPDSRVEKPDIMFNGIIANSKGIRADWEELPEGRHIVCLGDSSTFGYGLPMKETWPFQLQKQLRNNGFNDVTVINTGVPGYSSYQGKVMLRRIKEQYETLNPYYVIAMFGWNDSAQWSKFRDVETAMLWGRQEMAANYNPVFIEMLRRLFSIEDLCVAISWFKSKVGIEPQLYKKDYVSRVSSDDYMNNLMEIQKLSPDPKHTIVVEWPLFMDEKGRDNPEGNFVPSAFRKEQRRFAEKSGAHIIEMYPVFKDRARNSVYRDMGHGNAEGNRMLAEKIAEIIMKEEH